MTNITDISNISDEVLDFILGMADDLPPRRLNGPEYLAVSSHFARMGLSSAYITGWLADWKAAH